MQASELMKALEDVGGLPVGLDQAAKGMLLSLLEVFKEQTGREPTQVLPPPTLPAAYIYRRMYIHTYIHICISYHISMYVY